MYALGAQGDPAAQQRDVHEASGSLRQVAKDMIRNPPPPQRGDNSLRSLVDSAEASGYHRIQSAGQSKAVVWRVGSPCLGSNFLYDHQPERNGAIYRAYRALPKAEPGRARHFLRQLLLRARPDLLGRGAPWAAASS